MTALASASSAQDERTTIAQWFAVAVLTLATFVVVTSEMLPVGVLTPMADGLGISPGSTGISLTITGLVSAVTAPIVPRLLGNLDRRVVLTVAMIILAIGNALTAVVGGFGMLVVSRIILGIGMGAVWGMASAVATRLVAPRNVSLAVSFAVSGVASASVFGVPLGTFIGNAFGWRAAFAALAALSLLLAAALLAALPKLLRPEPNQIAPTGRRVSLMRPAVISGLIVVVFLVTAHFAAYTYVRPVLEIQGDFSPNSIALLLLLYGIFGLIGNFAAGALASRRPKLAVSILSAGITAAIVLLAWLGAQALITGIAIALWGIAYGGLSVGAQLWMTHAAPDRIEHITGLYVGIFTAAIAVGALLGGVLVEGRGIAPMLWAASTLAALATLVAVASFNPAAGSRGSDRPGG